MHALSIQFTISFLFTPKYPSNLTAGAGMCTYRLRVSNWYTEGLQLHGDSVLDTIRETRPISSGDVHNGLDISITLSFPLNLPTARSTTTLYMPAVGTELPKQILKYQDIFIQSEFRLYNFAFVCAFFNIGSIFVAFITSPLTFSFPDMNNLCACVLPLTSLPKSSSESDRVTIPSD